MRATLALPAALVVAFVLTAPWHIGGRDVGRLSACLAAAGSLAALTLLQPAWRRAWGDAVRRRDVRVSRRALAFASVAAAVFFGLVLRDRWRGLALSAWDTTLFFDHPIAATGTRGILYCRETGASYLGTHASWVLLAFLPSYAVVASPLWLLAAEALALSAGAALGFLVFRRLLGDDPSAALLAIAFVLNPYTARTVQYGFHPEAFYPAAIFLLWLGLLDTRPGLLAAGTALALSVKEDSVMVLLGFALGAAIFERRYRAAAAVAGAAIAVFLVSTRIVMPHASGAAPDLPWYASYWASWGGSTPEAAWAMLRHPGRLARAVAASGAPDLFVPLLFLPLAGPEALAPALLALVPYAAADYRPLRDFALYYAMPLTPFLFVAAAWGLRRLGRGIATRRLAAIAVLGASGLVGAGYTWRRPHPARLAIPAVLDSVGDRPVCIQGSLYPRAGYAETRRVLESARPPSPEDAILLCPGTDPYPYSARDLGALEARLAEDPCYARATHPGGLVLFTPRC